MVARLPKAPEIRRRIATDMDAARYISGSANKAVEVIGRGKSQLARTYQC
jgi:hypothetical protein